MLTPRRAILTTSEELLNWQEVHEQAEDDSSKSTGENQTNPVGRTQRGAVSQILRKDHAKCPECSLKRDGNDPALPLDLDWYRHHLKDLRLHASTYYPFGLSTQRFPPSFARLLPSHKAGLSQRRLPASCSFPKPRFRETWSSRIVVGRIFSGLATIRPTALRSMLDECIGDLSPTDRPTGEAFCSFR
jgi:hypothetical protein